MAEVCIYQSIGIIYIRNIHQLQSLKYSNKVSTHTDTGEIEKWSKRIKYLNHGSWWNIYPRGI